MTAKASSELFSSVYPLEIPAFVPSTFNHHRYPSRRRLPSAPMLGDGFSVLVIFILHISRYSQRFVGLNRYPYIHFPST